MNSVRDAVRAIVPLSLSLMGSEGFGIALRSPPKKRRRRSGCIPLLALTRSLH